MKHLPMYVQNHEAPTICSSCGGGCCKSYPGITSPTDFGAPNREVLLQRLTEAFCSGKWAIDWWEGDPRPLDERVGGELHQAYFIRPHVKGEEQWGIRDATYGGPCTFHTDTGCALKHDQRPTQCRTLVPAEDRMCKQSVYKQELVLAWLPYTDIILQAERMRKKAA